jgi:hypothetical protein
VARFAGLPGGTAAAIHTDAMNEEETDDVVLLEQNVLDAEDFIEAEVEPVDDDYEPAEEVILLDTLRLDDDDLLDFA